MRQLNFWISLLEFAVCDFRKIPNVNLPVAKTGKGNPPYKASNGGFLLFYGKRGTSLKVNSGREWKRLC